MELFTDINEINRVGKTTATRLKKLGILNVEDLLFYFPWRYDLFEESDGVSSLEVGEKVNVTGCLEMIVNRRGRRRKMTITEAAISNDSGVIKVVWFNQPFLTRTLKPGDMISLAGKIEEDFQGLVMKSPTYEKLNNGKGLHTKGLVPNYNLTANITQKQIRFLVRQVINVANKVEDWLPEEIKKEFNLLSLGEAIKKIHFPKENEDIELGRKRLGFDELFLIQMQAQMIKNNIKNVKANVIKFKQKDTKGFVDNLPFKLTDDQKKVSWEILQNIDSNKPMTRLLEGDVGSGKTIVAVIAMLNAAKNGLQSAIMVPTEILAKQHFVSLLELLKGVGINIALLTRSNRYVNNFEKKISKKDICKKIAEKEVDIIIGTHALIQEDVKFNNLSLIIIDEQHRFGVEQRQTLIKKIEGGILPHLLSMTATPIPRSLALAMYDDLDVSIIREMPKDRQKIITRIVVEDQREQAYQFIKKQIEEGRQVFVICPLIDESDKLGFKSVKSEFDRLNNVIFPDLNIGMMHGKLKPQEKSDIMQSFLDNKINILVSTSVIEVGIDVPNATVMMIENSDRFGLAQLHQYRGRVGRGIHQSYCFLLSDVSSPENSQRLKAMMKYDNGFDLAKADLKFRGPGEVYGKLQKGFPQLKIASLYDFELMKQAKKAAQVVVDDEKLFNFSKLKGKLEEIGGQLILE